jgi:LPXTG-motif cell wall-anchored protein
MTFTLLPGRRFGFMARIVGVLALLTFGIGDARPAQAQDLGLEITKTLRGGELVQVGQILEFVIEITNAGNVPIVELELVDEFVGSIVAPVGAGPFAEPGDPPLSDTQPYVYDGNQTITWQLLGGGARLDPGASLQVVVRLRAIRPSAELQTVNRARIERAIADDGRSGGGGSASSPARPEGARLPMRKTLGVPAPVAAGLPMTFTIEIRNDSLVEITSLPLRDVYNPAAIAFVSADPPPLSVDAAAGVLVWDDLLAITGRGVLRPGETLLVTTEYLALRDIDAAVNTAEVSGARDRYGNAVARRQAQAPIRVVGPDATPTTPVEETPRATARPRPSATPTNTSFPTNTPAPRSTIVIVQTATTTSVPAGVAPTEPAPTAGVPTSLPNTGASGDEWMVMLVLGGLLLGGAYLLRRRA